MADVQPQVPALTGAPDTSSEPPPRMLRKRVVLDRIGVSDTTLWRLVRAGKFPRPARLTGGTVRWLESEVNAWIAARMAERD